MTFLLIFFYFLVFVLLSLMVFLLTFYEWKSLAHRKKCRLLPSPKQDIIFGIGLQIAFLKQEDLLDYLHTIWKHLGDIFYFEVIGIPGVCLMNPEDIEIVFNSSQYIKKGKEYEGLIPWLCEGLLTSSGEKWHIRRKMLTPTFHFKILENFIPVFNRNAKLLTKKLTSSSAYSAHLDVDSYVSLCTLDVICETAMGVSLDFQLGAAGDYVAAVRRAGEIVLLRTVTFWMYNNFLFNNSPTGREFKKIVKQLHAFTEKIIKDRKESYEADGVNRNQKADNDLGIKQRNSFLDCLIEMQKENPAVMTDKAIREEVDTFMFEGHDTTSAALTWTLFMIATHPDVQERVRDELTKIFGDSDRDATLEDLHQMHYLEMVLKETLRLYPSVPYMSRMLTTDLKIKQYTIPTETNISIIPYLVHRNPKIYEEPEKFDPDRFLPHNSRGRHPYSYIPFSAGYRNCIGQKFAMLESKVILSTVLRNLYIHSSLNKEDVRVLPQTILRPSPKICLSFGPINKRSR